MILSNEGATAKSAAVLRVIISVHRIYFFILSFMSAVQICYIYKTNSNYKVSIKKAGTQVNSQGIAVG